ncbi:MAG: YdcF family protein, partial [Alphaproteobacteria bacterium]
DAMSDAGGARSAAQSDRAVDRARPVIRQRERHGFRAWVGAFVLGVAVAGIVLWCAGFVWFSLQIPRQVADPLSQTDAIIVLTGGPARLNTGLELLAQGLARKLFVSGVYRGVDVAAILRLSRQAPEELECCIELGHSAVDTAGNARETARWMAAEGFRTLRLVTASYHMPRSLAEFRRAMPDVELIAHPVFLESVHVDAWWRWPGTASLLASEFNKYIVSAVRAAWGSAE